MKYHKPQNNKGFKKNNINGKNKIRISNQSSKVLESEAIEWVNRGELKKAEIRYLKLSKINNKYYKELCNIACIYGKNNHWLEMSDLLEKVIKINPKYSQGFKNLGIAKRNLGEIDSAINSYKKALELDSFNAEIYYNIGIAYKEINDIKLCIKNYKKAIKLNSNYTQALNNLGNIYQDSKLFKAAIKYYNKALCINPKAYDVLCNLGVCLIETNEIDQAKECYRNALEIAPNNAILNNNLGSLLNKEKKFEEAINFFKKAININPKFDELYYNLSESYKNIKDFQLSEVVIKKAIEINPEIAKYHNSLGETLISTNNIKLAIESFKKAHSIEPSNTKFLNDIGTSYEALGDSRSALINYKKALDINSNLKEVYFNMGISHHQLGNMLSAIISYKKALEIDKDFAIAHRNLSFSLLSIEKYEEGLKEYEWRLKISDEDNLHVIPNSNKWKGDKIPNGLDVLVISEQGLGDSIQFLRYIKILKQKNCNITLCIDQKLHSLIKSSGIDSNPICLKDIHSVDKFEWLPLLSLPKYLGINQTDCLVSAPYISSDRNFISKWKTIFSDEKRPIIGINWKGNIKSEKTFLKGRSFPLEKFSLIAKKNIRLVSLQKGLGSEELKTCSFQNHFIKSQSQVSQVINFNEIAAIIINCDLIITSDTVVAHLAGALGKKTWLLLKYIPDWRWGLYSSKTFWYDSIRIFRQTKLQSWDEVFKSVSEELDNFAIN